MKVFTHFNLNYWKASSGTQWPGYERIPDKQAALRRKFYSIKEYDGSAETFNAPSLRLIRSLGDEGVVDGAVLCDTTVDIDRRVQGEIWDHADEQRRQGKEVEARLVCCGVSGTLLAAWNPYSLPDNAHPADVAAAAGISVPREIERVNYNPFSREMKDFFWQTREGRPIFTGACLVICAPTGVFALPQPAKGLRGPGRLYQIG
jgi:hypothetical protein